MTKQGTEFERLAKAIYEEILHGEGYKNVTVEHDVKLQGKSGQLHQIDVYWEFKIAGVTHRVAVECKEYGNTVSVGKVRDFYGAIEDIGNVRGIFVTTKGYQSGAIIYAEHKNISLKIISEPTEEEINSHQGIKEINLNIHAMCMTNVEVIPEFDNEWIIANTSIKRGETLTCGGMSNELKIIDSSYNNLGTLHELQNMAPRTPENSQGLVYKKEFPDGFLFVPGAPYPLLKLKSITFKYDTYTLSNHSVMRFKLMAEVILKDIITGETHLYNKKVSPENA